MRVCAKTTWLKKGTAVVTRLCQLNERMHVQDYHHGSLYWSLRRWVESVAAAQHELPRFTRTSCVGAHLIIENFHSTAGLVEESENLVFDVQQLLLIRGDTSYQVVMTLF